MKFNIRYDDDAMDIIDKVNAVLDQIGYYIVAKDDGEDLACELIEA